MTTFEIPKSVAANIAKRYAADRSRRPCIYGCRAEAHPYPGGTFCDQHAPWALAGRPDPDTQVDPRYTADGLRARMQKVATDLGGRADASTYEPSGRTTLHPVATPTDTITERFRAFDEANPHVRARLIELVEWHISQGARRLSIGALFEELRGRVETSGTRFQLDNSLRALYVRHLVAERPHLKHLFELRSRRSA